MDDLIPLSSLLAGQTGAISVVVGPVNEVHRLEELGLRQGTEIEMVRPGSPCIVRLAGHQLCLRADELCSVLVRTGSDA